MTTPRLLSDMTAAELDALPVGSVFVDPDDANEGGDGYWDIEKAHHGEWTAKGFCSPYTSAVLLATWGGYNYALDVPADARPNPLREALAPFAELAKSLPESMFDDVIIATFMGHILTADDFRRALTAMEQS